MDCNTPTPQPTQVTECRPIREMVPPPPLPSQRINQILAAVGWKYVPPGLDCRALERSIDASVGHYRALLRTDRARKRHKRQVERWTQAAEDAQKCLSSLRAVIDEIRNPGDFEHMIYELEEIALPWFKSKLEDLKFEAEWGPLTDEEHKAGLPWGTLLRQCEHRPPIDWLVGAYLPNDFKKHFRRDPSTTNRGPYVNFVWQVLAGYDIRNNRKLYERATISRTIS